MTLRLTITELCDEIGMAHGRARTLLRQAGIERDPKRTYPAEEARRVLSAAIDPGMSIGNRAAGRGTGMLAEASELAEAKAASERERTKKLALDNDIKAGKFVSRSVVEAQCRDVATYLRNSLLSFGPKLASHLVGKSEAEITSTINHAMAFELGELSDLDNYALNGGAS